MVINIVTIALIVLLTLGHGLRQDNRSREWKHFGSFHRAVACSVDPGGNIYVLDGGSSELVKFSPGGEELARVGSFGWSELSFDHPGDVIAPNGLDVYVADYGNHRVQRFDRNLNYVSTLASEIDENAETQFAYPKSISISRLGSLFFVDGDNKRILKLGAANRIERSFGGIEAGAGRLSSPMKIRVSENDIVYVLDGEKLVLFDLFGNYLRMIPKENLSGIRSFTVAGNDLYLLDSTAVYAMNNSDLSVRRTVAPTHAYDSDSSATVDLSVLGNWIILLREHDCVIVQQDTAHSEVIVK